MLKVVFKTNIFKRILIKNTMPCSMHLVENCLLGWSNNSLKEKTVISTESVY